MQLTQLHVNDEFTIGDDVVVFKVKATDDQSFINTGTLRAQNTITGEVVELDGATTVTLVNVL